MKNLITLFSVASSLIVGVLGFAQQAYADPIAVGSPWCSLGCFGRSVAAYEVIGSVIILLIIISVIALIKIRKGNVNRLP